MSGYDFSQEYANALLEEADRTIEGLEARLKMSDSALTEATENIINMREQVATLTRQRDLAVEALESCIRDDDGCIALAIRTLDTIKESENENKPE